MADFMTLIGIMLSFFIGGGIIGWMLNDAINKRRRRR